MTKEDYWNQKKNLLLKEDRSYRAFELGVRYSEHYIAELESKIKHLTEHLEPQSMTALFEQVEEEFKQEQRLKELEKENEEMKMQLYAFDEEREKLRKENAKLERKLEEIEKDLADYQFNYPTIKELQKENALLKEENKRLLKEWRTMNKEKENAEQEIERWKIDWEKTIRQENEENLNCAKLAIDKHDLQEKVAELDCQMKRNISCYSCKNATEVCFKNEIGCPCEKYESYKDKIAELEKHFDNAKYLNDKLLDDTLKLEKENEELKKRLKEHESVGSAQFWENVWSWKIKAKELLKDTLPYLDLTDCVNNDPRLILYENIEQFLKDSKVKK